MLLKQRMKKKMQNHIDLAVHAYKRDRAPRYNRTGLRTERHLYAYKVAYRRSTTTDRNMHLNGEKKNTQNQIDLAVHA